MKLQNLRKLRLARLARTALLVAGAIALPNLAHADYTATYVGLPFDVTPGTSSGVGDQVLITLTLAGDPQAGVYATILNWSFSTGVNDGGFTLSLAQGNDLRVSSFQLGSDALTPVEWNFYVRNTTSTDTFYLDPGAQDIGSYTNNGGRDYADEQAPGTYTGEVNAGVGFGGTWTITASPVPEPATSGLALAGLAAIGTIVRRRQRTA